MTTYDKYLDNIYYPIYRFFYGIWDNIKPSNFKHWYQRARYGYSYRDCWSIDWYLADIIPKMINQLKENLHGVPGEFITEDGEVTDKEVDKWESILDKIANTFKLEYEILESYRIMTKKEKKSHDEGWKLFRKYFGHLWD
jgi:hypothetical protein